MTTRAAIVAQATTWLGTPYHHCADVRGAGVDCAMLLVRVYQACDLTPLDFDPRPYSPQWHLHRSDELYLNWLRVAGATETTTPQSGDVVIWRFGRTYSHAAILIDQQTVIHALQASGAVTINKLSDGALVGRPCKFYSVLPAEADHGR